MATARTSLLFRDVTGATREAEEAEVEGATVGELVDTLEAQFPGLRSQVEHDGKTISTITFTVDGMIATKGLQTHVPLEARVAILPTFGGG
ncbi:MAG: MoaD/ThiS family protein [Thermoguttaceae bacterium]|jgi:molybdopterin converting factor small subunit|nr:MoaD/ThiS family protein [Thermoguttaceae bacterium]